MVLKVLAEHLETMLSSLISSNQTAHWNGEFISQGGHLISDVPQVCDFLKLKGLLLAVDIEKAFDSVNHNIPLEVPENYGFSQDFLQWISILLENEEWCVTNGKMRSWKDLRVKFDLDGIIKFYWIQIIHTIPLCLERNIFRMW